MAQPIRLTPLADLETAVTVITLLHGWVAMLQTTLEPNIHQFTERQVAFQVVDTTEGDATRGDWAGWMKGVVRPLLQW